MGAVFFWVATGTFRIQVTQKNKGLPSTFLRGAFFYTGWHNTGSLMDKGNTHRWNNKHDKDGDTVCVKPNRKKDSFVYKLHKFIRVRVKGYMTAGNILQACKKKKMKPVCDHSSYADGKCYMVGGSWHFSHPSHNKKYGVSKKKVVGAFFYTGRHGSGSLLNTGRTHKWATRNRSRDGDTFCVVRGKNFKTKHKFSGAVMHRVQVQGVMNSNNIFKACQKKKMRPVCDHASYADGRCLIIGGNWHMSHPSHSRGKGVPRNAVHGTFAYCGKANGQRSLLNKGNTHRWSNGHDKNGETICAKKPKPVKFNWGMYTLSRVAVRGRMSPANIRRACMSKKLRPICDHASYSDGKCLMAGGKWHFSHPSHNRRHKLSVKKLKGAFFYTGRHGTGALLNTGSTHKWRRRGWDRDGDTYCGTFRKPAPPPTKWHGYKMERVTVKGIMNSNNIYKACTRKGQRPVCDHASYADGRCVILGGNWHFSHPSHTRNKGLPRMLLNGAFLYAGRGNHMRSLQDTGNSHRWSNNNDRNGQTICTKDKRRKFNFKYRGYDLIRIKVKGLMTANNLYQACRKKNMLPVCDHRSYADSKCRLLGGSWHFSHPSHNRRYGIPQSKVRGAFFYTGRHGHGSLLNTGVTHKWQRRGWDRDGDTYCAKRGKNFKFTYKYKGFNIRRVDVKGPMKSNNIFKACKSKGMRPVCDHSSYADGRCILVGSNWHMSHPSHARRYRVPVRLVRFAYMYCGYSNHQRSLFNYGGSHRWSNKRDHNGVTLCTRENKKKLSFTFNHYMFERVTVRGYMTAANILKTCKGRGMKPVCDHASYADGKCTQAGGNWHFSHPSHNRRYRVPRYKVKGAFFYTGRHGSGSLMNYGVSHKWQRRNWDRDGDTYCVKRAKTFKSSDNWKGHKMHRVKVKGRMNSDNIYNACRAKLMRPVCDHASYADGRCVIVGGNHHISHGAHAKKHKIPTQLVRGIFTYCGRANHKKSLMNKGNSHRWSNNHDRDGETLCVKAQNRKKLSFNWGGYTLKRIKVKGFMTSANILRHCKKKKMRPLCDHSSYMNGRCQLVGSNWHFSHPSHDRRYKVPVSKVKGAYFYCGRSNGGLALLNTGSTHKWSRRNWDRDGDTFCVKPKKEKKFSFKRHVIVRVKVNGRMRPGPIYAACQKKGLRPVCDHPSYADGRCVIVNGNWHMSQGRRGVSTALIRGTYTYCGRRHQKSLLNNGRSHRWSNNHDRNGDTLCIKHDNRAGAFTYNKYKFVRISVKGVMTSSAILRACRKKKMKPVCDHAGYADGKCTMAGDAWHFSHPSHDRRHKVPVNKVTGAYFYCGRANGGLALMNTGSTHKWSHRRWDRDGDAYCVKQSKDFKTRHTWRGHVMERVNVKGKMTSNNIYNACRRKKLRPICDHASYVDGRCLIVGGNWHLSHPTHTKRYKVPRSLVRGAFIYAGRANRQKSLFDAGNTHRWSRNTDANGVTLCGSLSKAQKAFKWKHFQFTRVKVKGYMTSANVLKACLKRKLKPICDHSHYADGKCLMAGSNWHFSHPSHCRRHKVPVKKGVLGAYFYAGRASSGRAIVNTGVTHKWAHRNWDRDGDTFCGKRGKGFLLNYKWKGHQMHRVAVKGEMNTENIYKACKKKGMRPVCNHASYADGRCVLVHRNWHFNYPGHAKKHGVPKKLVHGTFMYCGRANKWRSLFNIGNSHRWSKSTDRNAETICIKPHRKESDFTYRHYRFHRVKVRGYMTSRNLRIACAKLKMKPVCDHSHYADGRCRIVGANWHFSHASHARRYGVPLSKVVGAYFYAGRSNGGKSLMNTGTGHKWSVKKWDRDGDTFCTKRAKSFKGAVTWRGFQMARVQVKGPMKSSNIYKACLQRGLRPVCNHPSYADGRCVIVGGNWHMSYPGSTKNKGLAAHFLRGTFTYSGWANHQRSLLDTGNSHRWSRNTDRNGETLCTKTRRKGALFTKGEWQFVRVAVPGLMTSPNILRACRKKSMRPVCDHRAYKDGKCLSLGNWHMSHPSHNRRHNIPVQKVRGAYFYCGHRNGGRTLVNTGFSHKWSRNGRDRDGDTFCARHISERGHGECKCKSVNSLMRRLYNVKAKCRRVAALKMKAMALAQAALKLGESQKQKGAKGAAAKVTKTKKVSTKAGSKVKPAAKREAAKAKDNLLAKQQPLPAAGPKSLVIFPFQESPKKQVKPKSGVVLLDVGGKPKPIRKKKSLKERCKGVCPDVDGLMREIMQAQKACAQKKRV
jgi:hypothetical protein